MSVLFPLASRLKTIPVLFPTSSENKKFESFPQPVYTKNMEVSLPSALLTKNIYGIRFTQPHDSKTISVLSPQPATKNIWILPSANFHQKYVGFVSLSLVSLKVSGLRFSQPRDSKYISVLFPSASRHEIFRFFPPPVYTKNMYVSFPLALSD